MNMENEINTIELKKLEWFRFEDGRGYISLIPEFGTSYAIWFQEGKTMTGDPENNHIEHSSKETAMEWCQLDFETRIKSLII